MSLSTYIHKFQMLYRWPLYRLKRNHIAFTSEILSGVMLRDSTLGDYTFIGKDCIINSTTIGNYTCIASNVQIGGMEHPHWDLTISPQLSDKYVFGKRTIIGHDVWIAGGCIIRQGVKIGDGAVIGANSFVNKDVEPYTIVAGTPAKVIKARDCKSLESELLASGYWNYPPKQAKKILEQIKSKNNIE